MVVGTLESQRGTIKPVQCKLYYTGLIVPRWLPSVPATIFISKIKKLRRVAFD